MEIEEEKDLTEFDKNVMELFDTCKAILKISEKRSLSQRKNPYLTRLEKYIKTYSSTDPVEHVPYFEKIYNQHKRFILLGPQRDSWLSDGQIIISFGEDVGIKTDMKLHLSGIYSTAVKTRDEIRDEIEGLPNSFDTKETGYPSTFMLLIYRIFHEIVTSENEKKKLATHVQTLETEAGVRSKNGDNPLSGILDMAGNLAEQFTGKKMSKDQMPGQQDFSKMLSSVMDNPKTKSMIGSMMQDFKGADNMGEMVTKLVGSLGTMGNPSAGGNNADNGGDSIGNDEGDIDVQQIEDGNVNDEFDDYDE